MTRTFKRHLYRLGLASATFLLLGVLAYDVQDAGIYSLQLIWFSYLLTFTGIMLCFKTLEKWSSWEEDTSVDPDEEEPRNPYPLAFYLEGLAIILVAGFLFVWTMGRSPTSQESLIFIWSMIVAIGCALTGRLSTGLE
jgi:hypothetical protein